MSDTERDANLEILRGTEAKLKAVLKEIPRAVVTWTPAPGKWSILEIVGHLRDMEKDAYLARYQRILSEEIPPFPTRMETSFRSRTTIARRSYPAFCGNGAGCAGSLCVS